MIRWAAALVLCAAPLRAQPAAPALPPESSLPAPCSYESCAFGIAPAWNGLDVVLGATGARVASLGFFLPRDISATFTGSDSALKYAARAVSVRRAGAVLTDIGALLLGYAAIRQLGGSTSQQSNRIAAAAGAAALAISVPLQFSADGLLSRAVWWHNARYAR